MKRCVLDATCTGWLSYGGSHVGRKKCLQMPADIVQPMAEKYANIYNKPTEKETGWSCQFEMSGINPSIIPTILAIRERSDSLIVPVHEVSARHWEYAIKYKKSIGVDHCWKQWIQPVNWTYMYLWIAVFLWKHLVSDLWSSLRVKVCRFYLYGKWWSWDDFLRVDTQRGVGDSSLFRYLNDNAISLSYYLFICIMVNDKYKLLQEGKLTIKS